jgi:hypothetical protein
MRYSQNISMLLLLTLLVGCSGTAPRDLKPVGGESGCVLKPRLLQWCKIGETGIRSKALCGGALHRQAWRYALRHRI